MPIENSEILKLAQKIYPTQVKWRRWFHQNPELSDNEYMTTEFINRELKRHNIKRLPLKKMKTGTAAIVKGTGNKTVAIRSDIDALPIIEKNKISFKSKNSGIMHACGHDMHIAVVMGAAVVLNNLRKCLPGNVKFLFQPAEEMPPGGAERMLKEGLFENPAVSMVFGLHVDPILPTGKISLRDGVTMAAVTDFDITIKGICGHAAASHKTVDAIAVASEVVNSMQKIVSREINPMDPVAISFGIINGGTARNVIADKVVLQATARALSNETGKMLPRLVKRTVGGICRAHGADYEINFHTSYPVLNNHVSANKILRESYNELFGKGKIEETPMVLGSEDFSFYLKKAPGAMFRLGIRNREIGATKAWHSADFMADEKSILYGTALLIKAVLKYFEKS